MDTDYWAKPGLDRFQTLLLYPTLDDSVSEYHPVRQLEQILRALDWSSWTQEYNGRVGQPPIPPWVMAGVILYGLMRKIRSSRQLEYACGNYIDFMWLAEGRRIDHSTFCDFRTKFKEPLKELFKQIGHVAMRMGFIKLLEVAFDGTRVKANASRFHTWTAEKVEAVLQDLETRVAEMLKEAETNDVSDASLLDDRAPQTLPPELADAQKQQEKLRQVLEELREADAARKKNGTKSPAQMPKADTDSPVMPNKEGGYAPNYTPTAATDGAADFIVDCDVIPGPNEQNELLPSVDRTEKNFGQKIDSVSADKAFGTGPNLEGMETRKVNFHTPVESPAPEEGNPAKREDPRQPVPEAERPNLPRNDKKKLAKRCFIYDPVADIYICPMGQEMPYRETKKENGSQGQKAIRIYACNDCANCPLAPECLDPKAKRGRTISRDGYEPQRERMHAKMQTEAARTTYNRRMHIGETPFAIIKGIMEVRRFLLRGLEKVRTEWRWVCTAYNLKKLITLIAALRAKGEKMAVNVKG
jgi:transposase